MPSESITVTSAISTGSQPVGFVTKPPATPEASPIQRLDSVLREPGERGAEYLNSLSITGRTRKSSV